MDRLEQSHLIINAAKYIQYGLRTAIIAQHTQLSLKYLRSLVKDITGKSAVSGQNITIPRLFKSKRDTIACILFVSIYNKANTSQHRQVDLDLLIKAFDCFSVQVSQLESFTHNKTMLSINDAWVLMNGYLNQIIELTPCCCGSVVVTSQVFELDSRCPFCAHFTPHVVKLITA